MAEMQIKHGVKSPDLKTEVARGPSAPVKPDAAMACYAMLKEGVEGFREALKNVSGKSV